MKVLKFGGSSLASPETIVKVLEIVERTRLEDANVCLVLSAFQGVTDSLTDLGVSARQGMFPSVALAEISGRHLDCLQALASGDEKCRVEIESLLGELRRLLEGLTLVGELTPRTRDRILSFGERLSARTVASALSARGVPAVFLDTREVVITDHQFGNAEVDLEETFTRIRERLAEPGPLPVAPGFIGSTPDGQTTTIGRNGSDYTAALFAAALEAHALEIWTDVDGVMTADPREVPKAFPIPQLTYREALELSHFGARVLYPPTLHPVMQSGTPLFIRNTFNPDVPGTVIGLAADTGNLVVKGISHIEDVAIISLHGSQVASIAATSARLFGALARGGVHVLLVTQASSERSICFAVPPHQATEAKRLLQEEFELERLQGRVLPVEIERDTSVVAVVGEKMSGRPGTAGRVFETLGRHGINIRAIAQGSSELNISLVVRRKDKQRVLNVLHDAFFLADTAPLKLHILGSGLIGSTLLEQIREQIPVLLSEQSLDVRVLSFANSRNMLFAPEGLELAGLEAALESSTSEYSIDAFIELMTTTSEIGGVFVDCTASSEPVERYEEILSAGFSIVTPNKRAASSSQNLFRGLKDTASRSGARLIYEANVGAALPILNTIHSLRRSGDRVLEIEAILSGTLSYVFNEFQDDRTFSEIVRDAQAKGYTEPDPREDLAGVDVARKLLILLRDMGLSLELEDLLVECFLPQSCLDAPSVESFYERLKSHDADFSQLHEAAQQKGEVLRHIASWDGSVASVRLKSVGAQHPFYSLSGRDNIVSFRTERYDETPLIIRGPGAGAALTAGQILSDLISLAS